MGEAKRIFIAYSHRDGAMANDLCVHLEAAGFSVWLDTKIQAGDDWIDTIWQAFSQADVILLLLSESSARSEFVKQEIEMAAVRQASGKARLIPISLHGWRGFPVGVTGLDGVPLEWPRGEPFEAIRDRLLQAIDHPEQAVAGVLSNGAPLQPPGAALPAAGATSPDSPYYVKRQADDELAQALASHSGQTILIAGPKQSGKSSLLARAYELSQKDGRQAFYVDFQSLDGVHLESLASCLRAIGRRIEQKAGPGKPLSEYWDEELGAIASLTNFLEREILPKSEGRVAICVDEADRIFSRSWAQDFFSMLRSWHNLRAFERAWAGFTLIVTHSTDPGLWIRSAEQSPFNVGLRLRLDDFNLEQVAGLCGRYDAGLSPVEVEKLFQVTGGQPYLVRLALWEITTRDLTVAELDEKAIDFDGPFADHLASQLVALERNELALLALKDVMDTGSSDDDIAFEWLRWAGLVAGPSRRRGRLRCDLYRRFFTRHFELAPLPARAY